MIAVSKIHPLVAGLKARRLEYGVSQVRLAKTAGISRTTLVYIEHGSVTPKLATCERIEKALDLIENEQSNPKSAA